MCGIIGSIGLLNIDKSIFDSALNRLSHRGPDNKSVVRFSLENKYIILGHSRLKIIDLSEKANQPYEDEENIIVFNGEVYNYKILQNELKNNGINLRTNSDTEVILSLYKLYGLEKTLNKLHGMFAFCIINKRSKKALFARDRIGIKPLYYSFDNKQFLFSSEIKAILSITQKNAEKNISYKSLSNFFYHRHIPEPDTIFSDIKALNSGEYLELDLNSFKFECKQYWQLKVYTHNQNENDIINKIDELLNESIKEHLVSDVPISFALSGGLDSSLLISMAKNYKKDIVGYTVKRGENDIDLYYSKKIANYLNVEQRIIDFYSMKLQDEDKRVFEIYDNPIACSSIFTTYLLYKEISKDFKVCISGDGADEIFGGYKWYQYFFDLKKPSLQTFQSVDRLKFFLRNYLRNFNLDDTKIVSNIMLDRFSKQMVEDMILKKTSTIYENDMYLQYIKNVNNVKDLMYVDFFTFLRFGLNRADLSSMAHSVENRVPFLDHRIVEYAFSIDPELFNKKGTLKYLLKKVAERYLPKEYIYREKKGFSAPIMNLLPVSDSQSYMIYIYNKWRDNFVK